LAARVAEARGKRGARAGGYGVLSRSGDKGARLAGDARERGPRRGRKREKGSGRLEAPVAERRRTTTRGGVSRERERREEGES
jgi:hypothetical protein